MQQNPKEKNVPSLPWWTWLVAFIALQLASQFSIYFKYAQGVADYYLPTAVGIVLVNLWGPRRTIPAVFINATLSTYLWGIENVLLWPVYAFPETLMVFLSWYLFTHKLRGRFWLPDIRSLLYFLLLGIFIPIVAEILLLESLQVYFGDQPATMFWPYFTRNLLSEFISNFGFAPLLLVFLTPWLQRRGWLHPKGMPVIPSARFARGEALELTIIMLLLLSLTFFVPFEKFWFVYGLLSLFIAIRLGFHAAVVSNFYIFLITYILPSLLNENYVSGMEALYIFLGTSLLFVFAVITGRVITDLRITETKLSFQNRQLELTNKELDRFVYSVSHDLSAPLKSILGLVNISRLTEDRQEQRQYIEKIETSVVKLENFIIEILDYSRNKRQELRVEQIKLASLCGEILENLRFMDGYHKIKVDMSAFEVDEVYNDRSRLTLILNNLLSNAIRFQKRGFEENPFIRISARRQNGSVMISIADNGEGIKEHLQARVFDMFFRGTVNSRGSGLGLYIAQEAAERISSKITLQSEYGKGSVFTLQLKNFS